MEGLLHVAHSESTLRQGDWCFWDSETPDSWAVRSLYAEHLAGVEEHEKFGRNVAGEMSEKESKISPAAIQRFEIRPF